LKIQCNPHFFIRTLESKSGQKANPPLREDIRQGNSHCDDTQLSDSDEEQKAVGVENNGPQVEEHEPNGNAPLLRDISNTSGFPINMINSNTPLGENFEDMPVVTTDKIGNPEQNGNDSTRGLEQYDISQYKSGANVNGYKYNTTDYGINRSTTKEECNSKTTNTEHDEHHITKAAGANGSVYTHETGDKVNNPTLSGTEDINNMNLAIGDSQIGNTYERKGNGYTSKVKKKTGQNSNVTRDKSNGTTQKIEHCENNSNIPEIEDTGKITKANDNTINRTLSETEDVGNMDLPFGGLQTGNTPERESSGNSLNMAEDDRRVLNGDGNQDRERQNIEIIYIRVPQSVAIPAENDVITIPMPVVHIRSLESGIA